MISFLPRIKTFGDLSVVATHSLFLSRRFQQKKHKSSSNRRGGAMNPPPPNRPNVRSIRSFSVRPLLRKRSPAASSLRSSRSAFSDLEKKTSDFGKRNNTNPVGSSPLRRKTMQIRRMHDICRRPSISSGRLTDQQKKGAMPFAASPLPLYQNSYRIFLMISPPCLIASSFCGSIFHARSGSDSFSPTITFSIFTTGHTFR